MTAELVSDWLLGGSVIALVVGGVLWLFCRLGNDPRSDGAPPLWAQWRRVAKSLPRPARQALARANRHGAAAPPELRELAVQRAEARIATIDKLKRPAREQVAGALLWLYLAMFVAGTAISSPPASVLGWVPAGLFTVGCLGQVVEWRARPRRRRRLVRSLELNRALLSDPAGLSA